MKKNKKFRVVDYESKEKWFEDTAFERANGCVVDDWIEWSFREIDVAPGVEVKLDEDGFLHCEDGPAFIHQNETHYNIHGKHHRLDGPAAICGDGQIEYYVDGKLHRVDGPAFILKAKDYDNHRYYYEGKKHRMDGPAVEVISHKGVVVDYKNQWFINGIEYTEEDWLIETRRLKLENLE
jgi:hypothetical protein